MDARPTRRSLVSRCARYAIALQALALLARLVWGDELSIHGGSAPIPVMVGVLLLQLPGLWAIEASPWIRHMLPGAVGYVVLLLLVAALSAAVWTVVFAAVGLAWRGLRRLAAARS